MERIEVLDGPGGRVVCEGYFCDLHCGLAESVDVVDVGLAERGVQCCDSCLAELDEFHASRDRGQPEPWELDYPGVDVEEFAAATGLDAAE